MDSASTPDVGRPASPGPTRRPTGGRNAWHRKASRPISLWLGALLVLTMAQRWVPMSRWLLVHMVTLGVATNSILVWGQHFTDTLLHREASESEHARQVTRIRVLNVGIVATMVGIVGAWPWVVVAGACVVGACLCWYAFALHAQVRSALPARFTVTVQWYQVAAVLLPVGATLGAIMAFSPAEPWQGRLLLAHQLVNLLGFVGLTAVGTLVTLWPTVLRTRMAEHQEQAGRLALRILSAAVMAGGTGAVLGCGPVVVASLVAYLVGLLVIGRELLDCALRKPPADHPGYCIASALLWLAVTVVWLAVVVARCGWHTPNAAQVQAVSVPFVAGFLIQLLLGAMGYLMPTVMGGGPQVVRASCRVMNRAGGLRVALHNAALVVVLTSPNHLVRVIAAGLCVVALGSFLPLTAVMVKTSIRERRIPVADRVRVEPAALKAEQQLTARRDVVGAALGIGTALGAVAIGRAVGSSSHGTVTPTGHTTRVNVVAKGMRFTPQTITVPAGDRLVLTVTNADTAGLVHDLYLTSGVTTGHIAPGRGAVLDAGIISAPVEGWCTIVGHREMGMVLHVLVDGAAAAATETTASGVASARVTADLTAAPGAGFRTRDPRLPAIGAGRSHTLRLTAGEATREVAPGVRMRAMTYDGNVMGPVITAALGDEVRCHLTNDGTMGHSVDFHAGQIAPDEPMRTIAPGQALDYRFTAHHAGIWLYHCATMPMAMHIAGGMYGAVVVPPHGIAHADREFVLVQQEAYLQAQAVDGAHGIDAAKMLDARPDLVLFNGHANQYVHAPLTARVGERVRIWVLAGGPSRGISFHVIGGQFDTVFKEGAYLLRPGNAERGAAQALDLGPAQGGFVELVFTQPGTYPFVNHDLVAAQLGARGLIRVTAR